MQYKVMEKLIHASTELTGFGIKSLLVSSSQTRILHEKILKPVKIFNIFGAPGFYTFFISTVIILLTA